jgi:hypothetical protein
MNRHSPEPDVLEAHWDHEQVVTFFQDLGLAAQVEHVQVRSMADGKPTDRAVSLHEAQQLFVSQQAKAIQIRYRFELEPWCDTLMVLPDGVKIIRTKIGQP